MANVKNERLKRRYFKWLRGARGYSEKTIVAIERAIHQFEESTNYKDFKTFCERQAIAFKKWLDRPNRNGQQLSNTTKYHTLRHNNAFFSWLATQSGFRSHINLDSVSYLSLDKRAAKDALSIRPRKFPSLQQVLELIESIKIETDLDRRDRALISLLLLTGIRYRAVCSLSLRCVNLDQLKIYQDPRLGVQTKSGKPIVTRILSFNNKLVDIFINWVEYLTETLKFGPCDPLFPKTSVNQTKDGFCFEVQGVKAEFWADGNSIREILRRRSKDAGLPYFNPHSFRHAACQLALRYSRTPEELKALSQNFGHEAVTTTLRSYGTLDDQRVSDVLSKMDFSGEGNIGNGRFSLDDLEEFIKSKKTLDK